MTTTRKMANNRLAIFKGESAAILVSKDVNQDIRRASSKMNQKKGGVTRYQ